MTAPTLHRGKIASPPRVLAVRVLSREDFAAIKQDNGRVVPRVKAFRDTHHRLARLVAAGLRNEEILRITGFSYQRLSTLKQDPAFQELISQYRGEVNEAFRDEMAEVHATAGSLIIRGLRQVEDHFDRSDECGDPIPLKSLVSVTSDLMDRFGFSKKTVNMNFNQDFAKKLEGMMLAKGTSAVIDAKAVPVLSPASSPQVESPPPEDAKPAAVKAGLRRWG